MTKKQAFHIYIVNTLTVLWMLTISSTYFGYYIIQNITVSNKSTMTMTGTFAGVAIAYFIKKRKNILLLRKYLVTLMVMAVVFQCAIAVSLLYDPFMSGIINTLFGATIWVLASAVEADLWNHIYTGSERTEIDNTFSLYQKVAMCVGSSTVLIIDSFHCVSVTEIAYGSVIIVIIEVLLKYFSIRVLESVLKEIE